MGQWGDWEVEVGQWGDWEVVGPDCRSQAKSRPSHAQGTRPTGQTRSTLMPLVSKVEMTELRPINVEE